MRADLLQQEFINASARAALGVSGQCRALLDDHVQSLDEELRRWLWLIETHQNYADASVDRRVALDRQMNGRVLNGQLMDMIDFEHHYVQQCIFPVEFLSDLKDAFDIICDKFELIADRAESKIGLACAGDIANIRDQILLAGRGLDLWSHYVEALDDNRKALAEWQNEILIKDADGAYGAYATPVADSPMNLVDLARNNKIFDLANHVAQARHFGRAVLGCLFQLNLDIGYMAVRAADHAIQSPKPAPAIP